MGSTVFTTSKKGTRSTSVFDRVARAVEKLFVVHGPLPPTDLAEALGIAVIEIPYRGIKGVSINMWGLNAVTVSAHLSPYQKDGALLHEIAHQLFHGGTACFYLESDPLGRATKYEAEAHLFVLLYALRWDKQGLEECGYNLYRFAGMYGVPRRVVDDFWEMFVTASKTTL